MNSVNHLVHPSPLASFSFILYFPIFRGIGCWHISKLCELNVYNESNNTRVKQSEAKWSKVKPLHQRPIPFLYFVCQSKNEVPSTSFHYRYFTLVTDIISFVSFFRFFFSIFFSFRLNFVCDGAFIFVHFRALFKSDECWQDCDCIINLL